MDVAAVEATGRQLTAKGHDVNGLVHKVDSLINQADSNWWGARGKQFVHEWRSIHRPALLRVATSIEGLGQSAINQAKEQREVSQTAGLAPVLGGIGTALGGLAEAAGRNLAETLTDSANPQEAPVTIAVLSPGDRL